MLALEAARLSAVALAPVVPAPAERVLLSLGETRTKSGGERRRGAGSGGGGTAPERDQLGAGHELGRSAGGHGAAGPEPGLLSDRAERGGGRGCCCCCWRRRWRRRGEEEGRRRRAQQPKQQQQPKKKKEEEAAPAA